MKKALKYTFKGLKIFLVVILVLFTAVFLFVSFHKKEIIRQVTEAISDKIDGKVEIGNMELSFIRNFPHVSLLLNNVKITDTAFAVHHHNFFTSKEVFVSINIGKLISKEPPIKGIRMEGGELYLYTDSTGYTNSYLVKFKKSQTKNQKTGGASNELKVLLLKDFRFVLDNAKKAKLYDFGIKQLKVDLNNTDAQLSVIAKADMQINSLAFNTERGSFLKDKSLRGNFGILYDKRTNKLNFDDIVLQISQQPFNLTGEFDMGPIDPQFKLRVHTKDVSYDYIRSALPAKLSKAISIASVDQPLDANAVIIGPLKGGEPKVDVAWSVKDAHLTSLFMDFDHASFTGAYSNEVVPGRARKDPNSKISLQEFKAKWRGLPVTAEKIEIMNLQDPTLTCDLHSEFPIEKLNEVVGSRTLDFKQGESRVQLAYSGPLVKNNNTNSFLNGTITFSDAAIEYTPRNVEMKKVNGQLVFKNSGVFVENLRCVVADNPLTMQGQASNLVTLVSSAPNDISINWKIDAPVLNLGTFLYLLKAPASERRVVQAKAALPGMAEKIDQLIERGKVHVQLNAAKLLYKDFKVDNAVCDITLLEDRYLINKVSMNHSGGRIDMKGSLFNKKDIHQADLQVDMDNVDVSKVFADFDNFGQDGITSRSLEGKLWANIVATMNLSDDGKVLPNSVVSTVDFSLRDGALINYEPVKKIQNFIFKKRDFDNIRFAELTNRLEMRNQEVKINRMEIQSTVLSMFVQGVYSQRGNTDLSIQVPLSNLKKRKEDYNPENKGLDKKTGSSIFLRGRPGEDGNIKFKLDLFNKYDKEKKAAVAPADSTPVADL